MRILFLVPIWVFIHSAHASASHSVFVNFSERQASVTRTPNSNSVFEASIETTSLPLTMRDSDFTFFADQECVFWTTPGTGPDNPGVCGEYRQSGWRPNVASFDIFSQNLVLKNLKTGAITRSALSPIELFIPMQGIGNSATPSLPEDAVLQSTIQSPVIGGCAVNEIGVTSRIHGESIHFGICVSSLSLGSNEVFNVTKTGTKFQYDLPSSLTYDVGVTGWTLDHSSSGRKYLGDLDGPTAQLTVDLK